MRDDAHDESLRRVSVQLAAACRPCPERGGDLAAACLCPCPVAVARRFLLAAADNGPDPGLLDTEPRGALRLQAWAAGRSAADCDTAVVESQLETLTTAHRSCQLPGCLACEARGKLESLLAERQACAQG